MQSAPQPINIEKLAIKEETIHHPLNEREPTEERTFDNKELDPMSGSVGFSPF